MRCILTCSSLQVKLKKSFTWLTKVKCRILYDIRDYEMVKDLIHIFSYFDKKSYCKSILFT